MPINESRRDLFGATLAGLAAAAAGAISTATPASARAEVAAKTGPAKGHYKVIDFRNRPPLTPFEPLYVGHKSKALFYRDGVRNPGVNATCPTLETTGTPAFNTADALKTWWSDIDAAGISAVVTNGRHSPGSVLGIASTELVLKLQREYPGRHWGLAAVNLEQDMKATLDEVDQALGAGLRGANVEPGYRLKGGPTRIDDPVLFPLFELMIAHDAPLQVQTGIGVGPDLSWSNMVAFHNTLGKFPRLKIILGHGGYPYMHEVLGCALMHENLFVCPDMYMFMPGGELYHANIARLPEQFVFGTAFPGTMMRPALAETLNLPLSHEVMANYLYNNAARLLKL